MKKIELIKDIHSSVLGFGCAPVMGAVSGAQAGKAIELALECGVNHFDLARSYGYGDAENFVGKLLKGKRSNVVIASKFGIKANNKARFLKPLKPLARYLAARRGKKDTGIIAKADDRETGKAVADRFLYRVQPNPQEMRKSLEESLRALRTDYLDYFFIHEPLEKIDAIDELLEFSAQLKKEGKIRAFGLAYMRHQQYLHEQYLHRFDILQFDNSPGAHGYQETVQARSDKPNIFFSPLRNGSADIPPAKKLKQLSEDFSGSVILCSMFKESHIKSNSEIFD